MSSKDILTLVRALPETERWPELATVFERAGDVPRPDWELPLRACEAVGGDVRRALPIAAAVACLQVSIMLVDDMLDEDPRGIHIQQGYGPASNLAFGFQAAAFRLVSQIGGRAETRAALASTLAQVALKTSAGQYLDIQNSRTEDEYWSVVESKSTPFYGGALSLGALAGGGDPTAVARLYELGVIIGEIIQIEDDLQDAMQIPANADWLQGRNNLLILYAQTTPHEERNRFIELLAHVGDPEKLGAAQQILVRCGAVSYCAFLLVDHYRRARRLLEDAGLTNPTGLHSILDDYASSLRSMLGLSGVEVPGDLMTLHVDETRTPLRGQNRTVSM